MGYTHYWKYNPQKLQNKTELQRKFGEAASQIKDFASYIERNQMFSVCGGVGEGLPSINDQEIWFNGSSAEGLDHETFSIEWGTQSADFCKTARKPYDLLVCFSLLTLSEVFPTEIFSFSSDGSPTEPEWEKAIGYYEDFTGKKAKYN